MKKSNLIKTFSVLILSVMLVLMCSIVNAADNNTGYNDLSGTLLSNNSSNNANTNSANNTANTNNATNNSLTNNTAKNTNKSNNSSVYNNTNLPKTGGVNSVILIFISAIILATGTILFLKNNNLRKEIKK